MLIEKISQITTGNICKNCGSKTLYSQRDVRRTPYGGFPHFKDNRVKCKQCQQRYYLGQISLELWSLYYFSIEATANKTSKELKVNYRTILSRFNFYRRRIEEYQASAPSILN